MLLVVSDYGRSQPGNQADGGAPLMSLPDNLSKRRLHLVEPRHELSGKFPRSFERLARSAMTGDATHRGLLFATATLSRRAISQCLPPSAAKDALALGATAEAWARSAASLKQVKQARSEAYARCGELESRTLAVLEDRLDVGDTAFDAHANRVVRRYLGLSVVHALSSVLLCCDGVLDPSLLLEVPKEVSAAIAYRNVALGPSRSSELRQAAWSTAEWEVQQVRASASHDVKAIAVQLLHEYLGVHWKNHVDAQRMYLEHFLEWATARAPQATGEGSLQLSPPGNAPSP